MLITFTVLLKKYAHCFHFAIVYFCDWFYPHSSNVFIGILAPLSEKQPLGILVHKLHRPNAVINEIKHKQKNHRCNSWGEAGLILGLHPTNEKWETLLQCNTISHWWLGANLESALMIYISPLRHYLPGGCSSNLADSISWHSSWRMRTYLWGLIW